MPKARSDAGLFVCQAETRFEPESLAMNHGFVDGNKRVAYACVELFLQLNGLDIAAQRGH